jgi:periplasmic protein TonB
MFEDSLMESRGGIRASSKYWSLVATLVNGGVLLAFIIWPLMRPSAMPTETMAPLVVAPLPQPPAHTSPAPKNPIKSEMLSSGLQAPSRIPKAISLANEAAMPPTMVDVRDIQGSSSGTPGGMGTFLDGIGTGPAPLAKPEGRQKVSVSSRVMAGNLLERILPQYPAIAKAARIQGIVVLQATISRQGLIQNLRVISGPPMLQQAATDAVRLWRYKPYLLNDEPVEVETTINVVFNLGL